MAAPVEKTGCPTICMTRLLDTKVQITSILRFTVDPPSSLLHLQHELGKVPPIEPNGLFSLGQMVPVQVGLLPAGRAHLPGPAPGTPRLRPAAEQATTGRRTP